MDSFLDDAADSRTSQVGQKRDLVGFAHPQLSASDSGNDPVQSILERAKTAMVAGHESAAGWVTVNKPSPSLHNPPASQSPQIPTTGQQTTAAPPIMAWNKGVQSGVRTSFGPKAPPLARPPVLSYSQEGESTPRDSMDMDAQAHVVADAPRFPVDAGLNSNPQEMVGANLPADPVAGNTANPRPNGKNSRKKKQAKITSENNPTQKLAPHVPQQSHLPRSPPASERIFKVGEREFALPELFRGKQPILLEELRIPDFIDRFLIMNAEKVVLLKGGKNIKKAFSAYIDLYYGHLPTTVRNRTRDMLNAQCLPIVWSRSLNKAKKKASEAAQRREAQRLRFETQEEDDSPHEYELRSASRNGATAAWRPSGGVQAATNATRPLSDTDGEDSAPLASPEVEHEDIEMPTVDPALDAALDSLEMELLQKYFPTVPGSMTSPKCLACASSGHKTFDCPALTCTLCGENHPVFACPKNQRCGKCRVKGHQITECPEKLSLAASEAGDCDLCHSRDHLENACHLIWRSFTPRPEEIRTVRHIPVYCYVCGAADHYGPECGLHHGKILSGGLTWSRSNLQKYLDPSSSDQAIAAGKDYSLPSLPKKGLSIKGQGQASNPITLDDSDDEADFIRPSVKQFSQQGGTSQHIHFAQNRMSGQAPAAPSSYREPNLPNQSRSNFGSNASFQGSARYGRERTFSPPPRYNDFRAGFNDDERYLPQGPSRGGYRPADEGQRNGGRPMPSSNNSRGGQSSRGRGAPARVVPARGGSARGGSVRGGSARGGSARGASKARGKKRGRGGK